MQFVDWHDGVHISSQHSGTESYSFEIVPFQGDSSGVFEAYDFCECPPRNDIDSIYPCDDCGRPSIQMLQLKSTKPGVRRRSTSNFNYNAKEERLNSNDVPKHRHKRLFTLHNSYISESEGLLLCNHAASRGFELTNGASWSNKKLRIGSQTKNNSAKTSAK